MSGFVRLDVKVWEGSHEHAELFSHIHRGAFPVGWSRSTFEIFLQEKTSLGLLADAPPEAGEPGGQTAGFALLRRTGPEAEILSIAVLDAYRQKGIGSALIYQTQELLRGRGVQELFLEVGSRNTAAVALYEKHGFQRVGERGKYYSGGPELPGDDAHIMRLNL